MLNLINTNTIIYIKFNNNNTKNIDKYTKIGFNNLSIQPNNSTKNKNQQRKLSTTKSKIDDSSTYRQIVRQILWQTQQWPLTIGRFNFLKIFNCFYFYNFLFPPNSNHCIGIRVMYHLRPATNL